MLNKDLATTILGLIIAAATAAMPIVEVAQDVWNATTIWKLVSAVGIAVFGYFTNKAATPVA